MFLQKSAAWWYCCCCLPSESLTPLTQTATLDKNSSLAGLTTYLTQIIQKATQDPSPVDGMLQVTLEFELLVMNSTYTL